jgi:hypothetical protein
VLGFIFCQRFVARDHIEQFLVNATLPKSMKCFFEVYQEFANVLIGTLHRRETARIFARKGFGTRAKERYEQIFANQGE